MSQLKLGLSGLALAIFLGLAPVVSADETSGTVRSISTDRHVLILRGVLNDTTYDVNKDAKVCLDGKKAQFGDLKDGDRVHLTYQKDGKLMKVSEIRGLRKAKEDSGAVRAVVAEKDRMITLKGLIRDTTYHLQKDATVWINGKEGELGDLREGDNVLVTYEQRGDQLMAINVRLDRK